jgi:hypothetical protein
VGSMSSSEAELSVLDMIADRMIPLVWNAIVL